MFSHIILGKSRFYMAIRTLPFNEQVVLNMLSGALSFLNTYRNNTFPNVINANNDLISETFHGGHFYDLPTSSNFNVASAYGQTSLANACFNAYKATGNVSWINDYAFKLINSYLKYFFKYPVSESEFDNSKEIWLNHWLCVSKGTLNVTEGFQDDILDPYNYGNFDTLVTFSNGVGVIPNNGFISKVYKIFNINNTLVTKNVYSSVEGVEPLEYVIDYYVSNYMLTGVKYRFYKNGTKTITNEVEGTVKLTEQYTGEAKVVWSNYISDNISSPITPYQATGFIDIYPMIYKGKRSNGNTLFTSSFLGMYSAYETFTQALFHSNSAVKWSNCLNLMGKTIYNLCQRNFTIYNDSVIYNDVFFYKKENSTNPLNFPGWNMSSTNDENYSPHIVQLFREQNLDKLNTLRVDVLDNVNGNPKVILENNLIKTNLSLLTITSIELASSLTTLITITITTQLGVNDIDYSSYYIVEGDSLLRNIIFEHDNFIKWETLTHWYPTLSNTLITPFNTDAGTVTFSLINDLVNVISTIPGKITRDVVLKVNLNRTNTTVPKNPGFSLDGFVTQNLIDINNTPKFFYKYKDNSLVNLVVFDENDNIFVRALPNDNSNSWNYVSFPWSSFSVVYGNTSLTRPQGLITKIEFHLINNNCEIYLYCIGQNPSTISSFQLTSNKTQIINKNVNSHSLWIGDFKTFNNTTDTYNNYFPGSVPFANQTITDINNIVLKNRWVDNGHNVAYVSPYILRYIGYITHANNQIKLIEYSQFNYFNQSISRLNGLLTPLFTDNDFVWNNFDINSQTATYNILPILSLSKYLISRPTNEILNENVVNILTKFIKTIEPFTSNSPITKIVEKTNPISEYENPSNAALIGLTAINANLLGIEPTITISIIKNCYNYLVSQYQSSGNMLGSFTFNQNNITIANINYKTYQTQYHSDCINFLSNLILFKNKLNIPETVIIGLFPDIAPNSIKLFKEAPYSKENLIFSDGNRQVLGYQKSKRGRIIEITYSAINAIDVQRIGQFWQLEGGITASFTLPTSIPAFSKFNTVSWRFQTGFKFNTKISNKTKGAFDTTIVLEQV